MVGVLFGLAEVAPLYGEGRGLKLGWEGRCVLLMLSLLSMERGVD